MTQIAGVLHRRIRRVGRDFREPGLREIVAGMVLVCMFMLPVSRAVAGGANAVLPSTALGSDFPEKPFSFIVYGDIQNNYQDGHSALVRQMLDEDVAMVFNTGDISPDGGRGYRRDFLPVIEPLARAVPFFPALGNHDVRWGSGQSRNRFADFFRPVLEYAGEEHDNPHLLEAESQKLWYRVTYGSSLFIVLDSNLFIDRAQYRRTHARDVYDGHLEEQLQWLVRTLEESGQDPRIKARFVFFHHSPVISSELKPFPILGPLFGHHAHTGHRREMINQKGEIEKVISRAPYSDYLERVTDVHPDWTARLEHVYPREDQFGRFHNYLLITVDHSRVLLEAKDTRGLVRDRGVLKKFEH